MAVLPTGFAQLCSSSVQEAHDSAAIAHAASLAVAQSPARTYNPLTAKLGILIRFSDAV